MAIFVISVRMFFAVTFSAFGLIAVAYAKLEWHAILGIVMTSFSCGLGESSVMTYAPNFNKYVPIAISCGNDCKNIHCFVITERNVIATWASGTGAAGIAGAFTYAFLLNLGFSAKASLQLMLIVPFIQAVAFFIILRRPRHRVTESSEPTAESANETTSLLSAQRGTQTVLAPTFGEKVKYIPNLFMYILPLFAVYFCEYFINQGLVRYS